MKFTDRIKQAVKAFNTKQAREVGNWRGFEIGGNSSYPKAKLQEFLNEYYSWTNANIRVIAQAVSVMNFKLMKVKGEDVEEVKTHALLDLIYRPNPSMTKSDFLKLITTYLLQAGEAPIRLLRNNPDNIKEVPRELALIKPSEFIVNAGITQDGTKIITGYEFNDFQKSFKLKPHEVVFIRNIDPNKPERGFGVTEAAASTIASLNLAEEYNLNFFNNSAMPNLALQTDQLLDEDTMARLENSVISKYGSVKNSHKTMILEAGLKLERIQNTAKDMDFVEQQRFMRDKLMAMFGTTKVMLGLVEDVNRANAEASELVFMKNTIKPLMSQICDYFNEFLLPVFDTKGEMFLTFDDPVPENTELILKELEIGVNKWITINEARDQMGLAPVQGGDVIYQPLSLQPVGTPLRSSIPDKTEGKEYKELRVIKPLNHKYKEEIIKLNNRNFRRKEMVTALKKVIKQVIKESQVSKPKTKSNRKYASPKDKAALDLYVKEIMVKAQESDKRLTRVIREIYDFQLKQIIKKLRNKKSLNLKGVESYLFDEETSIKFGIDLSTPVIEAIILEQGAEAFELLGITKPYELLTEARRYLQREPDKFIKSMTNTAYERARGVLADGIKEGLSVQELTKAIKDTYEESLATSQAENIVRTEVSRAMGFAQVDAYTQSGVVEGKEWVVTDDDRLCDFCAAMPALYAEKMAIPLEDNFFDLGDVVEGVDPLTGEKNGKTYTIDYADVGAEPLHNNCRCATIPVLEPLKSVKPVTKATKASKKKRQSKKIDNLLDELEEQIYEQRTEVKENREHKKGVSA